VGHDVGSCGLDPRCSAAMSGLGSGIGSSVLGLQRPITTSASSVTGVTSAASEPGSSGTERCVDRVSRGRGVLCRWRSPQLLAPHVRCRLRSVPSVSSFKPPSNSRSFPPRLPLVALHSLLSAVAPTDVRLRLILSFAYTSTFVKHRRRYLVRVFFLFSAFGAPLHPFTPRLFLEFPSLPLSVSNGCPSSWKERPPNQSRGTFSSVGQSRLRGAFFR
jgi:hypothetical protein